MANEKNEKVEETKVTEEATPVVETTAEVVETKVKLPAKVVVGNFVRKHRTGIIAGFTGAVGMVTGLVLGVKIGKGSAANAGGDITAALPDTTSSEPIEIEIPTDVTVE